MVKKLIFFIAILFIFLLMGCPETNDSNNSDLNLNDFNQNNQNTQLKCVSGDNLCLSECNSSNDFDCLKSCDELNGFICRPEQQCNAETLISIDSEICCSEECVSSTVSQKACSDLSGAICSSEEECIGNLLNVIHEDCCSDVSGEQTCCDGICEQKPKTCSELGGIICTENKYCSQSWLNATDSYRCCPISCSSTSVGSCEGVECNGNQKCVNGNCILKTCAEQNGYVCSENEVCEGNSFVAYDTSACCPYSCVAVQTDLCENVNCPSNQKCVNGTCVLKTCSELGGNFCETNYECQGELVNSSNGNSCCIGSCSYVVSADIVAVSVEAKNALSVCDYPYVKATFKIYNQISVTIKAELFDQQGLLATEEKSFAGCVIQSDAQGEYCEYDISFNPEERLKGKNLTVKFDSDNSIQETNENNNEISTSVSSVNFDFTTKALVYSGLSGIGVAFDESLLVPENNYYIDPTEVTFSLYVDSTKIGDYTECVATSTFDTTTGGRTFWIPYSLDSGTHEIKVIWDPQNLLSETNESNNEHTETIEVS